MLWLLEIHSLPLICIRGTIIFEKHVIFLFVCLCGVIGPTQNKLRQARVETIGTDVCNRKEVYDGLITPGMLCAGFMEGKVDACKVG